MRVLILIALLFSTPVLAAPKTEKTTKKIYCWEENGQKRCGDVLPSEAVEHARTERSAKTGTVTREIQRPPTREELAVQKAQEDAARQVAEQSQQSQRRTDVLLSTYATENDLLKSFAEREQEIVSAIQSMQKSQTPLHKDLVDRLSLLGNLELANKPPTAKQIEALKKARQQYLSSQAAINTLKNDIVILKKEQDDTLAVYRQAKTQSQIL